MKKITTLLLAAGMVFAASAPASAVDVKVDGQYVFDYQIGSQIAKKTDGHANDNFSGAGQRLRLGLTLAASENLSGYVQFQDDQQWGTAKDKQGDKDIQLRQAYIDWIIPQTPVKVRMGRQQLGLPGDALSGAWNAIMTTPWAGRDAITVSAPVADFMNVTAFWNRVDADGAKEDVSASNADAFGAVIDLKFDGLTISPWVMYANIDKGVSGDVYAEAEYYDKDGNKYTDKTPLKDKQTAWKGDALYTKSSLDSATTWSDDKDKYNDQADANAFWVGFSATLSYFDPFTLKLSGAYGYKGYDKVSGGLLDVKKGYVDCNDPDDRQGWYVQAKASYKTAYGTPVLGAWYASGDDADDYGRQNWIPTLGGRFGATPMVNPNTAAAVASYPGSVNAIGGTWGVQVGIEDVSFLEDLTHAFKVTMYKGTNNSGNAYAKSEDAWKYLTTEDTLVEFDLISNYNIYKNLAATLELGYIIADIDENAHTPVGAKEKTKYNDGAWRTGLTFTYKF